MAVGANMDEWSVQMSEQTFMFIGDERLPVVWSESRDNGGMFDSTVGVAKKGSKFVAFVMGTWGGGIKCTRNTERRRQTK